MRRVGRIEESEHSEIENMAVSILLSVTSKSERKDCWTETCYQQHTELYHYQFDNERGV